MPEVKVHCIFIGLPEDCGIIHLQTIFIVYLEDEFLCKSNMVKMVQKEMNQESK